MRKSKDKAAPPDKRSTELRNLFADLPGLSFLFNREVVIEGSKGVLQYSETVIRINTAQGLVCFEGRGLNLRCISETELIIDGFITKVEFVV